MNPRNLDLIGVRWNIQEKLTGLYKDINNIILDTNCE